jgi:hypothetical protein
MYKLVILNEISFENVGKLANKGILKYTVEKLTNLVPKKEGTILY